jgi:hypothetical protein
MYNLIFQRRRTLARKWWTVELMDWKLWNLKASSALFLAKLTNVRIKPNAKLFAYLIFKNVNEKGQY